MGLDASDGALLIGNQAAARVAAPGAKVLEGEHVSGTNGPWQ